MFYYYRTDSDKPNEDVDKLLSKLKKIEKVQENAYKIHIALNAISIFVIYMLFQKCEIHTKWYISLFMGLALGELIYSLFVIPLESCGAYRKLCKALNSPLFVKEMSLSKKIDEVDGANFPSLNVSYEVNGASNEVVALLCECLPEQAFIDENSTRKKVLITTFDTSKTGKGKINVSSEVLGKAINKLGRTNELIVLKACHLNKSIDGDFIKEDDINKTFFAFESFYFDFDYTDDEEEG